MPVVIGTLSKARNETLDFSVNWTNVLEQGETITATTVTVANVTLVTTPAPASVNGITTWWLTGGSQANAVSVIKITTSAGRVYERQVNITIQ